MNWILFGIGVGLIIVVIAAFGIIFLVNQKGQYIALQEEILQENLRLAQMQLLPYLHKLYRKMSHVGQEKGINWKIMKKDGGLRFYQRNRNRNEWEEVHLFRYFPGIGFDYVVSMHQQLSLIELSSLTAEVIDMLKKVN